MLALAPLNAEFKVFFNNIQVIHWLSKDQSEHNQLFFHESVRSISFSCLLLSERYLNSIICSPVIKATAVKNKIVAV